MLTSALDTFNPNFLQQFLNKYNGFSMIITGNTKSGKTHMLRHLLTEHINANYFDFVVVFSRTLSNGYYSEFIESKLMFPEYNDKIIETMIRIHNEKKSKNKDMKWLVILDDCVDAKSKFINNITNLFFSGRHYGASVIYLTQKISLMNTGWINNASIIITLFSYSRNEKEYLAKNVISDALDATYDYSKTNTEGLQRIAYNLQTQTCDSNYNALVIIPFSQLEKKIFKYKAEEIKKNKKLKFSVINTLPEHIQSVKNWNWW